ncbi:zinc transporter ZIP1-like [Saccoglossus kowalevskii]|uniref:Zinc transporter ZIP1-like n=1 Tax=Saccoglossus kowalevskii TaxID=10224 RepID=A0ABM0GYX4_SACKO|nr:PREDICTED: zinc transporter ZIP1-like [Saccoglossus kowalevskii]
MALKVEFTKTIALFGMLFLNLLFGLLPWKFKNLGEDGTDQRKNLISRILSFLSCFAGGVFLSTCLLDLLPSVRDNLSLVFDRLELYTAFPITEFVMSIGFFIIVIVEQTVLACKENDSQSASDTEEGGVTKPLLEGSWKNGRNHGAINSVDEHNIGHDIDFVDTVDNDRHGQQHSVGHSHSHGHTDPHAHSRFRSYVLILALSLHSVFEGLAVGLQKDNEAVMEIFTALILHKCILAFSLGMNLVQSRLSRGAFFRGLFCFAIMAPIGIAIGIGVMEEASDFTSSLINGILQGLATGTFLYVTFFEVLAHEMNGGKDRLLKVLFMILGFSVICGLLFLHNNVIRPTCYRSAEPV